LLTLYGLGTTIGAGIYVIIGATAGLAGYYTPLAFLLASVIAGLSAASFAELSTRYPVSAGEAAYIEAGLGWKNLSLLAGLGIAMSGAVSSATLLQGGVGYLQQFLAAPSSLLLLVLLAGLAGLVIWGIAESLVIAAVLTVVEVGGLAILIAYAPADPITMTQQAIHQAPVFDAAIAQGLSTAALLAFYAFIGFEDMVNVIEEVRRPKRTMPVAIFLTLVITTVLYGWVALIAITAVPPAELAASTAPLATVFAATARGGAWILSAIAVVAVLNGVIIQLVMASRVLYGLSRLGHLPSWLGVVSAVTHTPVTATLIICLVVAALGLTLQLTALAAVTSSLTLAVFALVNLSLWRLKGRDLPPHDAFTVPRFIPALGFLVSAGFLAYELVGRLSELFD